MAKKTQLYAKLPYGKCEFLYILNKKMAKSILNININISVFNIKYSKELTHQAKLPGIYVKWLIKSKQIFTQKI